MLQFLYIERGKVGCSPIPYLGREFSRASDWTAAQASQLPNKIKVAEHSFGSFMSICPLPNHWKRKVGAHKLKLGK